MVNINPIPFLRSAAKNSPWVVIAVGLHAVIIAIFSVIYIAGGLEKSNDTPTNVSLNTKQAAIVQPPELIERKAPPKNAEEEVVDYEHEMQYVPTDVVPDYSLEVGETTAEDSSGATGGTAIAAGAGPGHYSQGKPSVYATRKVGMGVFGQPRGKTQGTERAVRDGLLWLIRHQQEDGSWNAADIPTMCKSGSPCADGKITYPEHWNDGLTGLSLLAFLGAGYNFDSRQTIVDTVRAKQHHLGQILTNGLEYLKNKQLDDGSFGPEQHVYNQALCALALCEAYGLSNNNRYWEDSAQSAIDWLVKAQKINPSGDETLWGWRYHSFVAIKAVVETLQGEKAELDAQRAPWDAAKEELAAKRTQLEEQKATLKAEEYELSLKDLQEKAKEIDAKLKELEPKIADVSLRLGSMTNQMYEADLSVTTWVIMALKSARVAGLDVPDEAMEGGKRFVLATSLPDGLAGYKHSSGAGHAIAGGPGDHFDYHVGVMSALSMLCRTFIDHNIDDPFLEKASQVLVKDLPEISKNSLSIDYYYWYYGSLALNQFDGPDSPRKGSRFWDPWKRAMEKSLIDSQNQTDKTCTHGGWITSDRWAHQAGPIYSTAINVLTLEVYYRFPNAFASGTRFENTKKADVAKKPEEEKPDGDH